MSLTPPLLPRDCYLPAQVRRMFATTNGEGKLVLMSCQKLRYWRINEIIPSAQFGTSYMYPRAGVDAMIQKANTALS